MTLRVFDRFGNEHDAAWLAATYGATVEAATGAHWALAEVRETEGPVVFRVELRDPDGAPETFVDVDYLWRDDYVRQETRADGSTEFVYGAGGVIRDGKGPYTILVAGEPSDVIRNLGFLDDTDHRAPGLLRFVWQEGVVPEPKPEPKPEPDDPGLMTQLADIQQHLIEMHGDMHELEQQFTQILARTL